MRSTRIAPGLDAQSAAVLLLGWLVAIVVTMI